MQGKVFSAAKKALKNIYKIKRLVIWLVFKVGQSENFSAPLCRYRNVAELKRRQTEKNNKLRKMQASDRKRETGQKN